MLIDLLIEVMMSFFLQTEAEQSFSWYPNFRVPMLSIHLESSMRYYLKKDVDVFNRYGMANCL